MDMAYSHDTSKYTQGYAISISGGDFLSALTRGEVEGVVLSVRGCVTVFLSVGERSIETLSAVMSVYMAPF